MKQLILITLAVLTFFVPTPRAHAGWFTDDEGHKEQIQKLESQIQQQQQAKGDWQIIAFILGIGCVAALVAGAAIGSKGRRASHEK